MVFILYKLYVLLPYNNPTPKPTPYSKLSAVLLSQQQKKNSELSVLKNGDMG